MREIKFRAWFDGHMYEVAKLDFWGDPDQATCDMARMSLTEYGNVEEIFDVYLNEVELMQYTGLKDKNGKEIYEGDILDVILHNGEHENFLIQWDEREAGFEAYNRDRSNYILSYIWDECEVIGNIFENPELMT